MRNRTWAETGRSEKRSRLLPAHVMVYFVLAMAIFGDGYEEVTRRLVGGLKLMRVAEGMVSSDDRRDLAGP